MCWSSLLMKKLLIVLIELVKNIRKISQKSRLNQ